MNLVNGSHDLFQLFLFGDNVETDLVWVVKDELMPSIRDHPKWNIFVFTC